MSWILQVFCVLCSAAMLSVGLPNEFFNFGSPLYGAFALIPLYLVYSEVKSYKSSFLMFGLHALLVHLMSSYWLAFFKDFAALTLGASALGTAGIEACAGLMMFFPFSKRTKFDTLRDYGGIPRPYFFAKKILWFGLCYTGYEWCKSCGFLGYPWGTVSTAMYRLRIFTQIADITGTYGITFLTCFFAGVVAEGLLLYGTTISSKPALKPTKRAVFQYATCALTLCAFLAVSFVYGVFRFTEPRKPAKYLNAVLVQQNADPWKMQNDNDTILLSERLTKEKIAEAQALDCPVDLVVWSEGCLKYSMPRSESHYKHFPSEAPLIPFIQECGVPFLLGGSYIPDTSDGRHYNGALLFDKEGNFCGAYGKNHLVPLAEVVPFGDIPAVAAFLKKVIGISAGWTPGNQYVYFDIPCQNAKQKPLSTVKVVTPGVTFKEQREKEKSQPTLRMSSPICFDDAFPDVIRPLFNYGSELFMNITDDSWSMTRSAELQHFVTASFRTIETRSTLARSCNAGYSAVIDPLGRILRDMPMFEECAMFVQIPVYPRTITVYQRYGNWLPHIAVIIALCRLLYAFRTKNEPTIEKSERKKLETFAKKQRRKS